MTYEEFEDEVKKIYPTSFECCKNIPYTEIVFSDEDKKYIKQVYEDNKKYLERNLGIHVFARKAFGILEME